MLSGTGMASEELHSLTIGLGSMSNLFLHSFSVSFPRQQMFEFLCSTSRTFLSSGTRAFEDQVDGEFSL